MEREITEGQSRSDTTKITTDVYGYRVADGTTALRSLRRLSSQDRGLSNKPRATGLHLQQQDPPVSQQDASRASTDPSSAEATTPESGIPPAEKDIRMESSQFNAVAADRDGSGIAEEHVKNIAESERDYEARIRELTGHLTKNEQRIKDLEADIGDYEAAVSQAIRQGLAAMNRIQLDMEEGKRELRAMTSKATDLEKSVSEKQDEVTRLRRQIEAQHTMRKETSKVLEDVNQESVTTDRRVDDHSLMITAGRPQQELTDHEPRDREERLLARRTYQSLKGIFVPFADAYVETRTHMKQLVILSSAAERYCVHSLKSIRAFRSSLDTGLRRQFGKFLEEISAYLDTAVRYRERNVVMVKSKETQLAADCASYLLQAHRVRSNIRMLRYRQTEGCLFPVQHVAKAAINHARAADIDNLRRVGKLQGEAVAANDGAFGELSDLLQNTLGLRSSSSEFAILCRTQLTLQTWLSIAPPAEQVAFYHVLGFVTAFQRSLGQHGASASRLARVPKYFSMPRINSRSPRVDKILQELAAAMRDHGNYVWLRRHAQEIAGVGDASELTSAVEAIEAAKALTVSSIRERTQHSRSPLQKDTEISPKSPSRTSDAGTASAKKLEPIELLRANCESRVSRLAEIDAELAGPSISKPKKHKLTRSRRSLKTLLKLKQRKLMAKKQRAGLREEGQDNGSSPFQNAASHVKSAEALERVANVANTQVGTIELQRATVSLDVPAVPSISEDHTTSTMQLRTSEDASATSDQECQQTETPPSTVHEGLSTITEKTIANIDKSEAHNVLRRPLRAAKPSRNAVRPIQSQYKFSLDHGYSAEFAADDANIRDEPTISGSVTPRLARQDSGNEGNAAISTTDAEMAARSDEARPQPRQEQQGITGYGISRLAYRIRRLASVANKHGAEIRQDNKSDAHEGSHFAVVTGQGEEISAQHSTRSVLFKQTEPKQMQHRATSADCPSALDFQISDESLADANAAPRTTHGVYWSHNLYRSSAGKPIDVLYCMNKDWAEKVAQKFLGLPVLGFDAEWPSPPPRLSGDIRDVKNHVSLIQIASEDVIALFHVAMFTANSPAELIPSSLRQILASESTVKAGVNIGGDATRIKKAFDIDCKGLVELSHLYKMITYSHDRPELVNRYPVSLANQVEDVLGYPLLKDDTRMSNWAAKLNKLQQDYAASDAYAGFRLYHSLENIRLALDPVPPRPALYEQRQPVLLADGTVPPKAKRWTARSKKDATGGQDNVERMAHGEQTSELDDTVQEHDEAGFIDRTAESPSSDVRIVAADTWIEQYQNVKGNSRHASARKASLRAYHLWHHSSLPPDEVAAVLRRPPLKTSTINSYIIEALAFDDTLACDTARLKATVKNLPSYVLNRYKGLKKRAGMK
ncbi:Hypothetical protein D9617_10g073660 [Elsinoe fawcettii]|nr:Hypothetical protein D9617_10g073660 [Elsinoe fawcettii]